MDLLPALREAIEPALTPLVTFFAALLDAVFFDMFFMRSVVK